VQGNREQAYAKQGIDASMRLATPPAAHYP
jgi:hypothetical protein